jgi:hypothetical protein
MVLKGLPPGTSTADIEDELTQNDFKVIKIKTFAKKNTTISEETSGPYTPTIMSVIFDKGTDIKKVLAMRRLYYSVVSWEKYVNKSQVTQCYKCLKFGHISVNCNRAQKCLICAGNHMVKDCVNDTTKCSNCDKEHSANSKECEFYKVSAKRREKAPIKKTPSVPPSNKSEPSKRVQNGITFASTVAGPSSQIVVPPSTLTQTNNPRSSQSEEFNFIKEIKSLFKDLNMAKIINAVKVISTKLRSCNDTFEKVTTVLEVIFELF